MTGFILLAIVIIILLFLLSMVWPPDSPWSPWWRTSPRIARIQCKLANVGKNDIIYDLGSGEGTALIIAAKEFGSKGVGIEIDPFRVITSKISVKISNVSDKIRIERKNFFDVDISEASVIFMYLIPKAMARLRPKLLQELKPGTRVVTFVYQIDLPLIAKDAKNEVYVYEIPHSRKKATKK